MKKTAFTLIIALIILVFSTILVSAEEISIITTEEAENLITQMDSLYWKLQKQPSYIDPDNDVFQVGDASAFKSGYSFKELVDEAKNIYADNYVYKMLALTRTLYYVDGEVIITSISPQYDPYNANGDGLFLSGLSADDFKLDAVVTANENNIATIEFNYVHIEQPYENGAVIKRSNVTAVFENGKWRVNGGDYIDMLSEYHSAWPIIYPDSAPQTGVDTFAYAAVAVVALASVAVVVKKRRIV